MAKTLLSLDLVTWIVRKLTYNLLVSYLDHWLASSMVKATQSKKKKVKKNAYVISATPNPPTPTSNYKTKTHFSF